ncbi:MAG: flagellar basal body L-ring protein FlgH [Gammaproteobacteria bacterium]|nr:flagellar basal body L-ring protein FlgH [Gammaproteobacteria bacterium]
MNAENTQLMAGVIGILLLAGCASGPKDKIATAEEIFAMSAPQRIDNGSIFQFAQGMALFEDIKARNVGDMITIVLSEQTNATTSASTSTSKENNVDITNPTLLGLPTMINTSLLSGRPMTLASSLDSNKSFSGEGDSAQSNQLTGSVTALVTAVLPNGYLRIEGEKNISINQGDEYVRIKGIIRPVDIRSNNTISSSQVANAEISYGGDGVVASANNMGWLAKIFNSIWWPF